jgi:DNA-binding NarL/FixJ family response regulator
MTIDILIADDHAAVRAGLRAILENDEDIRIVGETADADEALAAARALSPDVVLLDVQMPRRSGLEVVGPISAVDGCRVLILTTFENDEHVDAAIAAGAAGFLLKSMSATALVDAVRSVAEGDSVLAPAVTRRLLERLAGRGAPAERRATFPAASARIGDLTPRERDVLALLGTGLSNAEVASELVISEATARTHVSNVLAKLGVTSRVHAAIVAGESGITPSGG